MTIGFYIIVMGCCLVGASSLGEIYKAILARNEIAERQITATYELVRAVNQAADNSRP